MAFSPAKKYYTPAEALGRTKKYCAFQERSHSEVRSKLLTLGIRGNDLENVMVKLIEGGFLNEERFAKAYAGGKFRIKHWGRKRIENQLAAEGVSTYCINKALQEIDDRDYRQSLFKLLKTKEALLKEKNIFRKKQKLSEFLIRKGYEAELVWQEVNNYLSDSSE